jgi:hypothetical protein
MNTQFVFEGKQKQVLGGFMAVGLTCLIASYFMDESGDLHMRFWTNLLHNSSFFTGIAMAALFLYAATTTAYSGWQSTIKRIWEAFFLFLMVGICLMGIICLANWGHLHHLYHWNDPTALATDELVKHKSAFLNNGWYTAATFGFVGIWIFFALKLRALSIQEDNEGNYAKGDFRIFTKMKVLSATFLPIFGFTSAAVIWQWLMSIDTHWYSTLYAWYTTASLVVTMFSMTILFIIYLKSKGYMEYVTKEHLHDLGKLAFGISVFWTYCWFSQFMLIWYANVGEETTYFKLRMDQYPVLFWGNVIMNFVLPFLILIRNDTKRKNGSLIFASLLIIFGHWWDFFQMIKPGAWKIVQEHNEHAAHAAGGHDAAAHGAEHGAAAGHGAVVHAATFVEGFTIPGLLEIGTFLGFAGLFIYCVMHQLTKASLLPKNDPFVQESMVHQVM